MNYTWEQNFDDLTITVKNYSENDAKNDLTVTIRHKNVIVKLNDNVILNKTLVNAVKEDEIVWYIDNKELVIELIKEKNSWWDGCFEGDEKVDAEELAKNNPVGMDGLDKEARMMVEKMMYEQQNKETKEEEMKRRIMEMSQKMDKKECPDEECVEDISADKIEEVIE